MTRTKRVVKSRQSSLLPGSSVNPEGLRYLEVLVSELEVTLQNSLAMEHAMTDRLRRRADMWMNRIVQTVPMEELMQPFTEADREYLQPPSDVFSLPTSLAASSSSASAQSTSAEEKPSTSKRTRPRPAVASAKGKKVAKRSGVGKKTALEAASGPKLRKPVRKSSAASLGFHTPLARTRAAKGSLPVITPKFDIRKRPVSARAARQGETLLSLSGSPVETKGAVAPVHVHLSNKGRVVKLKAGNSMDDTVKQLCRVIQEYCGKK